MQDKIMSKMYINKTAEGLFGIPLVTRSMTTKNQGYLFKHTFILFFLSETNLMEYLKLIMIVFFFLY